MKVPRGGARAPHLGESFRGGRTIHHVQARPGSIDEGIAFVRDEVMLAAMAMEGCVGLSMICDRESGHCIVASAWWTEDAMSGSEQMMQPLRLRGAEFFGARASVDRWEIAVLYRDSVSGEGACVRCTWFSLDAARLTHAIETFRIATLPVLEEVDGFCSASLMVDRATGRAVASSTFASRDAMVVSRSVPEVMRMRSRGAEDVGSTVTGIQEFELALAHLHVPEMA